MHPSQKEQFIKEAIKIIHDSLIEKGVYLLDTTSLEPSVLEIGKLYHELEEADKI